MSLLVPRLRELDHQIFFWANGLSGSWLDPVLGWPTFLGSWYVLFPVLGAGLWYFDRKNFARRVLFVLASLVCLEIAVQGLKYFFARPRPFDFFPGGAVHLVFQNPENDSFPSGHAAVAFQTAILLNHVYGKKWLILYPLAFLTAFSRIYIGVHFPTDVAAGIVLGLAGGTLAVYFAKKNRIKVSYRGVS